MSLSETTLSNIAMWKNLPLDDSERKEFEALISSSDELEIEDSFGQFLEFGTGGLRGVMGPGTNKLNRIMVGMATQGLANYLKENFEGSISIAIAYDSRNNSPFFAEVAAKVLSSNEIHVHLFDELRPTPELSFAIRELGCQSGIVVTASHNPPEYNGYKVYWEDGGQLVPPHDKGVIEKVKDIHDPSAIDFEGKEEFIHPIPEELDKSYRAYLLELLPEPEAIKRQSDLAMVFSSIHGTGITQVPKTLEDAGFMNLFTVSEQDKPDGNFPTVKSPNPEEKEALSLAIQLAKEKNAMLVMATDPDTDRVGIAIPDPSGEFLLLNGNQTGSLLLHYLLSGLQNGRGIPDKAYAVKTIVTSDLLCRVAKSFQVECTETLTGFKYIAEIMRQREGVQPFLMGAEESYGYLFGDGVRDKDAVASCLMIAQMAASLAQKGLSVYDSLGEIYNKYGLFKEILVSVVKKGVEGKREIQALMETLRSRGIEELGGEKVIIFKDYLSSEEKKISSGEITKLKFPPSNVLQFIGENGSVLSIRPSGTEPKIKFYYSRRQELTKGENWRETFEELDEPMKYTIQSLLN